MKGWVCICRFGGVGDNLIASSVLRPLKKMGYMIDVISEGDASAVFLNNPFIDKLSIKKQGDVPQEGWQKWFAARSNEYDLLVNLSNSCETRHALHYHNTWFHWPDAYRRKLCAGSYLETACDIVGVPHDFGPLYYPTENEMIEAERLKQKIGPRYVTWILSGSRVDKIYPYAAMAVGRIIRELDIPVVMSGVGEKQNEMAVQMKDHVARQNGTRDRVHIAVAHEAMPKGMRWGIRTAFASIMASDLVITPDTGAAWAVAFEPMPKIVMVSHASAENITKHWVNTETLHADPNRVPCWPCHKLHDSIETCVPNKDLGNAAACISDITVETIVETARKMLYPVRDGVVVLREAAE